LYDVQDLLILVHAAGLQEEVFPSNQNFLSKICYLFNFCISSFSLCSRWIDIDVAGKDVIAKINYD
jgi:hypothetical protein